MSSVKQLIYGRVPSDLRPSFLIPNKSSGRHMSCIDAGPCAHSVSQSPALVSPAQFSIRASLPSPLPQVWVLPDPSHCHPALLSTCGGLASCRRPNGLYPSLAAGSNH